MDFIRLDMKIAVITNLYPPINRGGAEKVIQRIVQELHRRGHDVFVISTTPMRGLASLHLQIDDANVERIYRVYPPNIYHTMSDYKYPFAVRALWHVIDAASPWVPGGIRALLEEERPDVVLIHNLKGIGMRTVEVVRKLNLPHILTVHDVQLSVPSGLLLHGENSWVNRGLTRAGYEYCVRRAVGSPDLVISPSRFLADFYRSRKFFLDTKTEVLPNPAPNFHVAERGPRSAGPLRLLFAGQLERHKGVKLLLDAVSTLDMPYELHIAGEGTMTKYVTDRAARDPRVVYHGYVSTEQLIQLFRFTDAVVMPSLCYENSPTVIYESFQAGVPVIASNIGGIGELVEHGFNGLHVPPADPQALADAIRTMNREVDAFRSRERAIRERMAPHHLPNYVSKLEKLIERVITKRNGG